MTRTAAIYARVSKQEQTKGHSLDTQVNDLRAYAKREGLRTSDELVFVDPGVSGTKPSRPALDALKAAAQAGDFEVLLVRDVDRLARDTGLAVHLSQFFGGLGIEIVSVSEGISLKDDGDGDDNAKFMYEMRAVLGSAERRRITRRSQRGRLEAALQGKWWGGELPYGCRAVPHPSGRGKVLELDEAEASALRDVQRWVVDEGASMYEAARRLNEAGIPTRRGHRWDYRNLRLVILNPRVTGTTTYKGNEVSVPQILTAEEHADLEEVLADAAKKYRRRLPKGESRPYPLTRRAFCPCGAHMHGATRPRKLADGKRRVRRFYVCSRNKSDIPDEDRCPVRWWLGADEVERVIGDVIYRRFLSPGSPGELETQVLEYLDGLESVPEGELDNAEGRVERLENQYATLIVEATEGDLDPAALKKAVQAVEDKLSRARAELEALRARADRFADEKELWSRVVDVRDEVLEGMSLSDALDFFDFKIRWLDPDDRDGEVRIEGAWPGSGLRVFLDGNGQGVAVVGLPK